MSPYYRPPDLHISVPTPPAVIRQAESAVVAFIGLTEQSRDHDTTDLSRQPVMIGSLEEYETVFGTSPAVPVRLQVSESTGGIRVDVDRPVVTVPERLLYHAVAHFFANGGGACYIISAGDHRSPMTTGQLQSALQQLNPDHPATVLLCPDICNAEPQQQVSLARMLLAHCADNRHRFCILDVPDAMPGGRETVHAIDSHVGALAYRARQTLSFGGLYYPYLHSTIPLNLDDRQIIIVRHVSTLSRVDTVAPGTSIADREIAIRYPHLLAAIRQFIQQRCRATLPPSGAMAGIYQKVDAARGVWKAPANVELAATHMPAVPVDRQMNQQLNNALSMGVAVNPVRLFPRRGTRVWGARTLAGSDPEWRYINVRRLAGMIHHSVSRAFTHWRKDANTQQGWTRAGTMIDNFLMQLWSQGAFAGATPDQAYFTSVGYGLSMTQEDMANDRLVLQLGFAPMRPAEFVVLSIPIQLS